MADIAVSNETLATYTRKTKDGRTLRYDINILQQPQRARACGAGAKSSADRRPVDPPPVVELKIFDGDHDITFAHNANFFLYTTLETARPIATPKGISSTAVAPQHPVLTGTPVAGIAYLDRPEHAGYFIFPDLSVRHEGRYRLSFNLYEEGKHDADMEPDSERNNNHPAARLLNRPFLSFRMEVKSEPFSVYSAKKFPGLAESTNLSRVVAEQGCRVRIRRDARLRVRDKDKHGGNDQAPESQTDGRYSTPVSSDYSALERSRATNNSSALSNIQPYAAIEAKPPKMESEYNPPPYPHHKSIAPHAQSRLNNYVPSSQACSQGPPPPPPSHRNNNYAQPLHSRHNSSSSTTQELCHQNQYQSSLCGTSPSVRDISGLYSAPQAGRDNSGYSIAIDTKYTSTQQPYQSMVPRSSTPSSATNSLPPPSNMQSSLAASPASSSSAYDNTSSSYSPQVAPKTKRGYSSVFHNSRANTAAHHGARPETSGEELPLIETEDYGIVSTEDLRSKLMITYRRADGSTGVKKVLSCAKLSGNFLN